MSVSADSNAMSAYDKCFNSRTDYSSPNQSPDNYDVPNLNSSYTYCFCAGRTNNGIAIFTDSPTLIATSSDGNTCSLTPPSGYHYQSYSYSYSSTPFWHTTSQHAYTPSNFSGEWFGYVIYRNDCTIVDSDGNDIDTPLIDEKFEFDLSAWTDYSIRGYASTNTDYVYRVQFYICPVPDLSASVDLVADDLFVYLSSLADSTLSESDSERIKNAFESQYPLVYEALEIGSEKIVKAVEVVKQLSMSVVRPDSPVADGIDYAVDLINQVRFITDNSYYGYRGFGGRYIGSSGTDFTVNVLQFYSNVRNSPHYSDVNSVYAVFSSNSDPAYPVAVLSSTFRVSDFFPSMTFPPLSVPSPSVIDGQPSTPNNSGNDWTIFQHAMYMQYLLDQLNRDFAVSLSDFGSTFSLPDYAYTYDSTDLVPYDFDVSVPDISAPDGLPLDLARPVSFLGTLWSNVLDSTGLDVIIPWCMIIGLVGWFFYGKN